MSVSQDVTATTSQPEGHSGVLAIDPCCNQQLLIQSYSS